MTKVDYDHHYFLYNHTYVRHTCTIGKLYSAVFMMLACIVVYVDCDIKDIHACIYEA